MIIANPIFDTVFKRLMENKRVARFFVEALIDEPVVDIAMVPQEYTYFQSARTKEKKAGEMKNPGDYEILSVIRFDFVATIQIADGEYKKVLIEIQKSQKATDLLRFRTYLGEQYKRLDMVEVDGGKVERALPIISIYLLGFKLSETDAIAIKVCRTYKDLIDQKEIEVKSPLIECLTHDGYFVQIPRIQGKTHTRLEKMLSVFEQKYFIDDKGILKEYDHPVDDENVKEMVEILQHTGSDPKEKRALEEEWWSNRLLEEYEKDIEDQKKKLKEKDISLKEKDKSLKEKDKSLKEKDKNLKEKDKSLKEKDKSLKEKDKKIKENRKKLEEKDELIENLMKELERLKK